MAPSQWQRLNPFRYGRKETAGSPSMTEEPLEACPQGLKIVAEGQNAVVDIIAVHGLNGHQDKTWTAANGKHWLRDLLPNDLPNARIFCWGYDANTHGDGISCQYLYDHATTLVADLCLERRLTGTTTRPIIFVAHSLGGIIVKSALIHPDAARKGALEEHRSIKTSTYGIMFMGTPHQGGSGVQLGKLLVNVALVFVAADDRLLKHLERDSEWLQQQLGQYGPIGGDFVTKFAYEQYKTPTALGSIMVVPRASAVTPGAADAESIVIHADHIHMVKFESERNSGYKTVSGHLRIMAQSASGVVLLRWEEDNRVNIARANPKNSFLLILSLNDVSETEHFVARQEELADIHKALGHKDSRRTVVLQGLGGIGKTQLAVMYAKLHKTDYTAVFWLNIKDENSLKHSFAKIARRIFQEPLSTNRPGTATKESNLDEVVDIVKLWLDQPRNSQWLIVFDNYDNPKVAGSTDEAAIDIHRFLPEVDHGSIIITKRSSKVNIGHRIQVRKLKDIRDSLQILSNTSHRDSVIDDPFAAELAKELDGLPLALATAGAYLDQVATSFRDYLRLYKESWLKLQQTSPEVNSYEDRALYSTWQPSFDYIKRQSELAAQLLKLWAYFDNRDLWFELLRERRSDGPEWISQLTEDELSFNQVVRVLCHHGLVELDTGSEARGTESMGYGMHSCVNSWKLHMLNKEWDAGMANVAIECVASHASNSNTRNSWVTQQRLIHHAAKCWSLIRGGIVKEDGRQWVLHILADLYTEVGKLAEAEQMYERALQGEEKALSAQHTSTRALQGEDKALSAEHTSTLNTVHKLGTIYARQSKLAKAEQMYERALQGKEKALGVEHTSTLHTVNNLGLLYTDQGKLAEAEQMYERALQGYKKVVGTENIWTLNTINNLGLLYVSQGKLAEAEQMYKRSLQGKEKVLGAEHILTLDTVNNLGILYAHQGKLAEAEQMYEWALQGYEKALSIDHSITLDTIYKLGTLYNQKCYAAANLSSNTTVLVYVKQLTSLCIKFPPARLALFDGLVRAFASIGEDEKSAAAFAYELALSLPKYHALCDGCEIMLSVDTSRLVCTFCKNTDLCRSCFNKLKSNELGEVSSSCQGHRFLALDDISIVGSSLTDGAIHSVSIEQWLEEIADM